MFSVEQMKEIKQMGISICEKTGEVKYVSPNKFASYIKSKSNLKYNSQGFWNYKTGKWFTISDMQILSQLRNILHKYNNDIWNTKLEKEYVEALKRMILISDDLNSNRRYINVSNGMYDLDEHILVPHSPEFYSTIQIPIAYDGNAECPMFMKFLDDCFLGDEESKLLAQEWAGYLLTAETKAQKALISYDGKNITYDAIGNPLNDGTYNYALKEGRQLKTILGNGQNISYKYNYSGIRSTIPMTVRATFSA